MVVCLTCDHNAIYYITYWIIQNIEIIIIEWPIHMDEIKSYTQHRQAFSFQFDAFHFSNVISALCCASVRFLFGWLFFFLLRIRSAPLIRKVNARICNNLILAIWFIILFYCCVWRACARIESSIVVVVTFFNLTFVLLCNKCIWVQCLSTTTHIHHYERQRSTYSLFAQPEPDDDGDDRSMRG